MSESDNRATQIEQELAALGEDAPSEAEFALLQGEAAAALERAPELASVARLVELAEPHEFDDLSELETHRGWRSVEQRLWSGAGDEAGGEAKPRRADASGSAAKPSSAGAPRRLLLAAFGLAAAAAVVLVVVLPRPGDDLPSTAELSEMGDQARAALKILDDGKSDSERAAELADQYAERMERSGG